MERTEHIGRVAGQVALVTGASLGIGRATALLLAKEGAAVAVTDVKDNDAESLMQELCESDCTASYWHLDVSNEQEVNRVLSSVRDKFGPTTILVNNAGIAGVSKPTHELTAEEWDAVQNVNVKGVFFCTKYAIPQMIMAKHGSIINMSSIYGIVGGPDVPSYHASKGAVRLMTKTDALFYAKYRIRVNSIHPGFIWTPMVEEFLGSQGDVGDGRKAVDSLHPLGHMGEANDIAYGVLYLASNESKFVTGSELVIDGGYTCR